MLAYIIIKVNTKNNPVNLGCFLHRCPSTTLGANFPSEKFAEVGRIWHGHCLDFFFARRIIIPRDRGEVPREAHKKL